MLQDTTSQFASLPTIITSIVLVLVSGFSGWIFGRGKIQSDIRKNESDIIKNYVEMMSELSQQIDSWMEKVKAAIKLLEAEQEVTKGLRDTIAKLNTLFSKDKAKMLVFVVRALNSMDTIVEDSRSPDVLELFPQMRMEAVRVQELLYSMKSKLEG